MDRERLRRVVPFTLALMFFVLAASRPDQRAVWIAIGGVFLIIGIRRRRQDFVR